MKDGRRVTVNCAAIKQMNWGLIMPRPIEFAGALLMSSELVAPSLARAQSAPSTPPPAAGTQSATPSVPPVDVPPEEPPADVSIPGADIVVTGRRDGNLQRTRPEVVSVLSSTDIARTGEGDIAGALSRVTGLSVVGNGFVYVRGLGDRYSLALLNGSPLPSPEPLRRVVPLDLFPTTVIASSLVQKSYSVNFPGEFGGGVINLTTKAVPKESFLSIGAGVGLNTETTNRLGYTYYGSKTDWTGFDNGNRDNPPALDAYLRSGERISSGNVDTQAIGEQLINGRNAVIQRNRHIPPNASGAVTGGTSFDLGGATLGVIATAGYGSTWRTRDVTQQTAATADLSLKELDFRRIITDNRIVVNGLLGLGLEFGENRIRLTNLYIRDTLKQARFGEGTRQTTSPTATLEQQDTAWFARQLIDTQAVGEFKLSPELTLDLRGGYANSKRQSPDEFSFEYVRSNSPSDPFGNYFINRLNGNQGRADVSYSNLRENLWSAGADLSYKVTPDVTFTTGYAYTDTNRRTERRDFQFRATTTLPTGVALLRPDLLLEPAVINYFNVNLIDTNEFGPVFRAKLRNYAGYGQVQAQITPEISLDAGVRYEVARQQVSPVQVFTVPSGSQASTLIRRNYALPAATLTYKLADDMQIRLAASKTIARPQFRELVYQFFFDPESNRRFRGNPNLTDGQLYNAEARYEWYFARDQRFSLAGFFKRIEKPIEAFVSLDDNSSTTSFANAPKANLYGAEVESQKYFDLSRLSEDPIFASRRAVVIANYTYSHSTLKVGANDSTSVFASASNKATDYFRDGSPLIGQSDHLVNLQLGLEDTSTLSQQTLLLTYASKRVTARGTAGQPDLIEKPGIHLDFVLRQGVELASKINGELKLEVRNITGTRYQEYQQSGANRVYYNLYDVGTTASAGFSINF